MKKGKGGVIAEESFSKKLQEGGKNTRNLTSA
jgi:hypothetical protein